MATKKKTTSTRKKTTTGKKQRIQEMEQRRKVRNEIIYWCIVVTCIVLFVSNFGIGGTVGSVLSGFFFGLFGIFEYVFPVLLLIGSSFVAWRKNVTYPLSKYICATFFCIFLCVFACLIQTVITNETNISPSQVYLKAYRGENRFNGGIVGAGIAHLLISWFGKIAAFLVDIIVILVSMALFLGKSAMEGVHKGSKKVYESAKENNEKYREYREEKTAIKQELKEKRRMDRKVSGVSKDTKILPEYKKDGSDEMCELHPDSFHDMTVLEERKVALTSSDAIEPDPAMAYSVNTDEIKISGNYIHHLSEQIIANAIEEEKEPVLKKEEAPKEPVSKEALGNEVPEENKEYIYPPTYLLKQAGKKTSGNTESYLRGTAEKLCQTLKNFGVNVKVTDISCGPAVTRYELQPEMGVKVSKIVGLADDIKLNLAASDIRIEAPIPGKAAVGIEVPNRVNEMVSFRDLIESEEFTSSKSKISFAVGKDIAGKTMVTDIAKMPHLLIAGATGSGKSVCINTIIMSILYKAKPNEVKLIMIDPKVVELSVYNGIPHLMIPVVTDPKKAAGALNWAVAEMTDRYNKFAENAVRDINGYNARVEESQKMPQIVIIVDELADLMMVASNDVEEAICRLAQLARAAGIHLIIATQRPSVNVITGLIKANMPSRIAFAVTSGIDSRTILDMVGAEKLLGKGDMLFNPQGIPKPLRIQGAFVSDDEVSNVVKFLKEQNQRVTYSEDVLKKIDNMQTASNSNTKVITEDDYDDGRDNYFYEAGDIITTKEKASIGMLQRYLKVGFNRAARIMDQLEEAGVVGPEVGTKPREVKMTHEEFQSFIDSNE